MRNIGIFGGTFNPIHNGHLHLCTQMGNALSLDEIILIPTHKPPHKQASDLLSDEHRLAMCRLAISCYPHISVSEIELTRKGLSYTIDTLTALKQQYPDDELYFLMGSDMLLCFDKWYRHQDILSLAHIAAGARNKEELETMQQYHRTVLGGDDRVLVVPFEAYPVSSTQLRDLFRVKNLGVLQKHLPKEVFSYLQEHKLYLDEEESVCGM